MKKKIVALCLAVALLAVAAIGGTLAYFHDEAYATNVLTSGNVEIILHEDNDATAQVKNFDYQAWLDEFDQKFHPGVTLEKDAFIENTGTNGAYVRMFVAIPTDALPLVNVEWDADIDTNWTAKDTYEVKIEDDMCTVYCYTWNEVLEAGKLTTDTITSIGLKPEVECFQSPTADYSPDIFDDNGDEVKSTTYFIGNDSYKSGLGIIPVYVHAQAVQITGFADADSAFDAAFGKDTAVADEYDQNWWIGAGVIAPENVNFYEGTAHTGDSLPAYDDGMDPNGILLADEEIHAETMLVLSEDSYVTINNVKAYVDTGIVIEGANNTTILMGNCEFYVEDGQLIATSNPGGQTIFLTAPITINGEVYTSAMHDQYFENILVFIGY